MQSESKICQNCKQSFVIEAEDFAFYERMNVPPPTFCPDCRLQRRLVWRNERTLYKRKCDLCKTDRLAVYPSSTAFPVFCPQCFWSDRWNPMEFGIKLDFSKPFFEQYRELLQKVPRQGLMHEVSIQDATYANYVDESRNVYLSYSVIKNSENVFYSKNVDKSRWVFDSFDVTNSEHCYQMIAGDKNYGCTFAYFSRECIDCSFVYDCVNCRNCFLCTNLRNKEFYIENKPYSKEEYVNKVSEMRQGGFSAEENLKKQFSDLCARAIYKYARITNSANSSGDDIRDSKNLRSAFNSYACEDCVHLFRTISIKDSIDTTNAGFSELFYEFIGGGAHFSQKVRFCSYGQRSLSDVHYIDSCNSSSYLFGCIGLKNKQYCILNTQYTKDEYELLVPRIIEHMKTNHYTDREGRTYRYGEFFPVELSPFAYNETIAQEYFPLTKEEVLARGYVWKDQEGKGYAVTREPEDLSDPADEKSDSVLKETIGCAHEGKCAHQCTSAFKIIPEELELYRKMKLSFPRLCPNCRHHERLSWRNPLKLWHRKCQCAGVTSENGLYPNTGKYIHGVAQCSNEFETPYAPDRPETVYCESCYQSEVV